MTLSRSSSSANVHYIRFGGEVQSEPRVERLSSRGLLVAQQPWGDCFFSRVYSIGVIGTGPAGVQVSC